MTPADRETLRALLARGGPCPSSAADVQAVWDCLPALLDALDAGDREQEALREVLAECRMDVAFNAIRTNSERSRALVGRIDAALKAPDAER